MASTPIVRRPIPGEAHAAYGMGLLLTSAGFFAYYRKNSIPSLVGSLSFAGLYFFSGEMIRNGSEVQGHGLATLSSITLGGFMGTRIWKTGKVMPGGPVVVLATISGVYHGTKYLQWRGDI